MLTNPPVGCNLWVGVQISHPLTMFRSLFSIVSWLWKHFQPGEGPSRGLLRDCEIFGNLRINFVSRSSFKALLPLCWSLPSPGCSSTLGTGWWTPAARGRPRPAWPGGVSAPPTWPPGSWAQSAWPHAAPPATAPAHYLQQITFNSFIWRRLINRKLINNPSQVCQSLFLMSLLLHYFDHTICRQVRQPENRQDAPVEHLGQPPQPVIGRAWWIQES